ncbi:uncharacterized protein DUF3891 [Algoriphagus ratkowskyi]|uniref:DUF3891 family protein n=1 Tax=Algoriphagus ratkowskyi TaxID=57028 RepID=A0A2W7R2T1_9BACT|nr:DUF3891 family protein [Algoriphagus ratkowskyi]PZX53516.1 uncharacterized protein DUF3891 [Algoriphagus ratkowskyi]TXD76455.1 DUF3891 family protein [Algoriphagus ratkowskyi]
MIVTKNPGGWNIFFHRSHALLAFKIGFKMSESLWPLPEYRLDGLSAITDHDNGQPKWNKSDNLTKAGAPLDFRQPSPMHLKYVKSLISECLHKSAFMTLMVSMHCCSIYKNQSSKEVVKFLRELEELSETIGKHLNLKKEDINECYRIVRFCDELSLTLCQGDLPKMGRKIQVEPLPGMEENFISKDEDGIITLDNWCFDQSEFKLSAEFYTAKKLKYISDHELISEIPLGKPMFEEFYFKKL